MLVTRGSEKVKNGVIVLFFVPYKMFNVIGSFKLSKHFKLLKSKYKETET